MASEHHVAGQISQGVKQRVGFERRAQTPSSSAPTPLETPLRLHELCTQMPVGLLLETLKTSIASIGYAWKFGGALRSFIASRKKRSRVPSFSLTLPLFGIEFALTGLKVWGVVLMRAAEQRGNAARAGAAASFDAPRVRVHKEFIWLVVVTVVARTSGACVGGGLGIGLM
eukprot:CAMPEP_0182531350 /NCGR_PEP_ID=MMETSP1323-20130603/8801_1 /TAXON_ID=236787 /ORGANISM="Florenciella parvula, Strain RCC1693" /LENGTH=170 /DNA_ID=CAMNT_0024740893 /DNA_START=341 /DNA_END=851 /DNA_ORIENTATION=-